jgi:hypothetical protein
MSQLSERTLKKLRTESEEVGGKIYDDNEDAEELDLTHFDEDDDPLTNVGDVDGDGDVDEDDRRPVGEVPDENGGEA